MISKPVEAFLPRVLKTLSTVHLVMTQHQEHLAVQYLAQRHSQWLGIKPSTSRLGNDHSTHRAMPPPRLGCKVWLMDMRMGEKWCMNGVGWYALTIDGTFGLMVGQEWIVTGWRRMISRKWGRQDKGGVQSSKWWLMATTWWLMSKTWLFQIEIWRVTDDGRWVQNDGWCKEISGL